MDGRRRRLELVTGGGHEPLEAEAHRPLGDVADRTTPPQVRSDAVSGSATASNQRRLPSGSLTANSTRKRSPRAARCWGRSSGANGRPATSSDWMSAVGPPKSRSYDGVGRDDPAVVVDGDDRVADAGQDRAQPVVLLLGLPLLDLHGGRLQPQLLGPSGEVLVGDAQLLDGRGQLLVERLELLVGRLELLVEGLDLLATRPGRPRSTGAGSCWPAGGRRSATSARRWPAAGGR